MKWSPVSAGILINPGPVKFGLLQCKFLRNKGSLITDTMLSVIDVMALTEMNICQSDTDSFLRPLIPANYKLLPKPRVAG